MTIASGVAYDNLEGPQETENVDPSMSIQEEQLLVTMTENDLVHPKAQQVVTNYNLTSHLIDSSINFHPYMEDEDKTLSPCKHASYEDESLNENSTNLLFAVSSK